MMPRPKLFESGEYFNQVFFDDAILSVVHVLTLMDKLYDLGVQHEDELDRKVFSKLTGLHTIGWEDGTKDRFIADFNKSVDKIKEALSNLGVDAGKLSKDQCLCAHMKSDMLTPVHVRVIVSRYPDCVGLTLIH